MRSPACIMGSPRWSTPFHCLAHSYLVPSARCCYVAPFPQLRFFRSRPNPVIAQLFFRSGRSLGLHTGYTVGVQEECRYTWKPQLRNPGRSSSPTARIHGKRVVRSIIVQYSSRLRMSSPVTLALLPYKSSAERSS